jgi:hypothetical protein
MKTFFYIFVGWALLATAFSCNQPGDSPANNTGDFEDFYRRFHEDEAYQMAHITFPLEGLPAHADSELLAAGTFRWDMEDWEPHRPFDATNSEFRRELTALGDDLVIEKIVHRSGAFGTLRRFARLGGEWYLIYYAGMNRMQ